VIGSCHSAAPVGVSARIVEVEVDLYDASPATMSFVGLPDSAVREARDRVKAALHQSGYWYPAGKRVVVNLAPADLRKEGSAFDLPIAVALLRATGQLGECPRLRDHLLVGELSLDGRVRPVRGALCMADRAARGGRWRGFVLPPENAGEASLARGLRTVPVPTLSDAVAFLAGADPPPVPPPAVPPGPAAAPDFSEVRGQEGAVRAALLAAAGGHNLLLVGPPGSGKTMIAERIPSILPPLDAAARVEATKIHSVAGTLRGPWVEAPPFRAPHHSASAAGLLGGGPRASPGEITLAHRGVLFLDELPEFDRRTLEGLREPLERGEVSVVRVHARVRYPSRFLLVAAMNPCPCGGVPPEREPCPCTVPQRRQYASRVSGPLLDRIDLQVRVPPVAASALASRGPPGPRSADLRAAVARVRGVQGLRGRLNAALSLEDLDRVAPVDPEGERFLAKASDAWRLSARAHVRLRRLARTIADLEGAPRVLEEHLREAASYRLEATGSGRGKP
jgi:magnesium chelatase family protein